MAFAGYRKSRNECNIKTASLRYAIQRCCCCIKKLNCYNFGDRFKMKNAKIVFPMEKWPSHFLKLASPMWFEHTAFRLGGGRSIQLSYGDRKSSAFEPLRHCPYYNTAKRPQNQGRAPQTKNLPDKAVASPCPAGFLLLRSHKPLILGFLIFRSIPNVSLEWSPSETMKNLDFTKGFLSLVHWTDPSLNCWTAV